MSSFEDQYGFRDMVRPKRSTNDQLLLRSSNGLIVGFLGSNRAYVAYDPNKKIAYSQFQQEGAHTITNLSPFVLLDQDDAINDSDAEELLKSAKRENLDPDLIRDDQNNLNPRVRELAEKLVAKLSKEPPQKP